MQTPNANLNLSALQRLDPLIAEVIDTVAHVTIYTFLQKEQNWQKKEIEGALFIVKRLNTQNLIEAISLETQLQKSDPFILYKNSVGEIYGIWFYESTEREKIYGTFERILKLNTQNNQSNSSNQSNNVPLNRNSSSSLQKTIATVAQSQFPKSSSLTKEQLKQVLQELVKEEDFIDLVYSEYLSLQSKGNI